MAVVRAAGVELVGEFDGLGEIHGRVAVDRRLVAVVRGVEVEAEFAVARPDVGLELAAFVEAEPVADADRRFGARILRDVAPAEGVGAERLAAVVQTGLRREQGAVQVLGEGRGVGPVGGPGAELVGIERDADGFDLVGLLHHDFLHGGVVALVGHHILQDDDGRAETVPVVLLEGELDLAVAFAGLSFFIQLLAM